MEKKPQNIEKAKKISLGVLAHVDAGKTTLSEGLLFKCGRIRKAGRACLLYTSDAADDQ